MSKVQALGQYPTPVWAAELLIARHFGDLGSSDLVLEPSCGPGAWLGAVPEHVEAIGVDIDPDMVLAARYNTGRRVLLGDFRSVELNVKPTVVMGNPPFDMKIVDGILNRSYQLLDEGGRVGLLLPAYAFQTAGRVSEYADRWSLFNEMIPRNIYPGLRLPLVFAMFTKDRRRKMIGFALYDEATDVLSMPKEYKAAISAGGGSVWRTVVEKALGRLGGEADLKALYAEIEGRQPTKTQFWREQIRKVLRQCTKQFKSVGEGRYALNGGVQLQLSI